MPLSCECDFDGDGWYYRPPDDYTKLSTKKRKRCCSCKNLIDIGAVCGLFERGRPFESDIEEKIYSADEEVPLANYYMCETCTDLYFSLDALGFCIDLNESMQELTKEYARDYG